MPIAPSAPERTCVGCRKAAPRAQLLRIVRDPALDPEADAPAPLRADPTATAPGRGAWIHPDAACLELALTRGGFARSFRGAVETGSLSQELEILLPTRNPGNR